MKNSEKYASFPSCSRRQFLSRASAGIGSAFMFPMFSAMMNDPLSRAGMFAGRQENRSIGIALVGLGKYSEGELAPALEETKFCRLAGIVTGSPDKAEKWARKYDIPEKNIYNYQNFDQIRNNPDIDVIYIVLPNGLHAEYSIRASQAGKHVICEKPMATSVEDCQRMIDAAKKANRLLSIGYRLHYEPHNLEMMRLGQQKIYGPIRTIKADDSIELGNDTPWRLDKELAGGGPLLDVGIYCVQAAIYTSGQLPAAVTAKIISGSEDRFTEVEEGVDWVMEFPGGLRAECRTSYTRKAGLLRAEAQNGWFELDPAYSYTGITGKTSEGKLNLPKVNQQARQMDAFAEAILTKKQSRVPGEMGLRDVKILQAIYQAGESGKRVEIT